MWWLLRRGLEDREESGQRSVVWELLEEKGKTEVIYWGYEKIAAGASCVEVWCGPDPTDML